MMIGFLILVIAGFLTGPSKILHLPETSATLMLIGLYLLGTGVACTIVPVIPEMLAATGQNEKANDKVSAIFNIFGGFGQIFSPPMAGFLNDTLGFNYSLDACALSVICFLTVYFVWCDGYGAMIKSFSGSVKNVDKIEGPNGIELDISDANTNNESTLDQKFPHKTHNSSMTNDNNDTIDLEEESYNSR